MTARMVLSNIGSFALQITVLVIAAAALARALRIDEPRAMLVYWRTLLLACLVLPLCQPWNTVIPPPLAPATIVASGSAAVSEGGLATVRTRSAPWPIADLVLIGLAAGVAARTLWLTIGAFGLRRLRRDAWPLEPLPESVRHAQERIGTHASMYVSDRISGPITFGLLRPVVVFPPSVSAMPAHVQEAIAYHELLHVERRDWLDEIAEEAVRSALWFHPAIWWLIGRIRLTREQVVDQAAIQLTNSKERYVQSLLAVALANTPTAFTPASPFLRRHLLKTRVARILQENTMTTGRLIASLTASAAALTFAATLAVRAFPLEAQGRAPDRTGEPIQILRGAEHLLHGERPEYPHRAIEQKVEGDVVVDMTLNDRGEVSDARIASGPEELRKATLEAVLQWHYSPSAIGSTVMQATVRFRLPAAGFEKAEFAGKVYVVEKDAERHLKEALTKALDEPAQTAEMEAMIEKLHAENLEPVETEVDVKNARQELMRKFSEQDLSWQLQKQIEVETAREPRFDGTLQLVRVRTERVSEETAREVLARAEVAVGAPITEEVADRIRQAAQAIDEHFRVEFQKDRRGGLILTILAR